MDCGPDRGKRVSICVGACSIIVIKRIRTRKRERMVEACEGIPL
jgi:hypothetical protein